MSAGRRAVKIDGARSGGTLGEGCNEGAHGPACKPGSVPGAVFRVQFSVFRKGGLPTEHGKLLQVTVISLARRSPGGSSSLPESRNGPDQPCSLIWPCSRWGLPSQPVTRLLVGSYIKGLASPHRFTLTLRRDEG